MEHAEEGFETVDDVGHFEEVVGKLLDVGVALRDHSEDAAAAALYLLHVGNDFVVELVVGGNEYNGHLLVYQGNRAVLHFRGGIALGVDVADFPTSGCRDICS